MKNQTDLNNVIIKELKKHKREQQKTKYLAGEFCNDQGYVLSYVNINMMG